MYILSILIYYRKNDEKSYSEFNEFYINVYKYSHTILKKKRKLYRKYQMHFCIKICLMRNTITNHVERKTNLSWEACKNR